MNRIAAVLSSVVVVFALIGIGFHYREGGWSLIYSVGGFAVAGAALLPLLMEYVVLRLLGTMRLGAVVRVTYYEALLQPFTLIVVGVGVATIVICAFLPFYTLYEDHKMYRDIASAFVQFFALVVMIYAAAKVVDEEIENRTMLTLMSKPISRWEVIVGKYLGVVLLVGTAMGILALAASTAAYLRYFEDMRIDIGLANLAERTRLYWDNDKAILALIPTYVLQFLGLATLAAISVAISTRYGLALNIAVIMVLFVGANLTRYVPTLQLGQPWNGVVYVASLVLPYLSHFDLTPRLLYGTISINEQMPVDIPTYSQIWAYVGLATVYGLFYIGGALGLATMLFRTRELS